MIPRDANEDHLARTDSNAQRAYDHTAKTRSFAISALVATSAFAGAFEVVGASSSTTVAQASTVTVCWDGSGDYLTIQEGIDAAVNGDEVTVCDGTYTGAGNKSIQFNGKAITLRSENGPDNCIIDCEATSTGFRLVGGLTPESIVDGFTIANGSAVHGGAIYCRDSSPTIANCVMSGNSADNGTVWIQDSSPTIINCTFSDNSTSTGGGIYSYYSTPTIRTCTFSGNSASYRGGGIRCWQSGATITNCRFSGNSADDGGGLSVDGSSSATITNCTISGNSATNGGGVYTDDGGTATLSNCILWNDAPQEVYIASGTVAATYSDIQGGWAGAGNINLDPAFVDPLGSNHRLLAGSPCIDAGDNAAVPPGVTTDLDGNPRFADDPATPDTGLGAPPIVDMGAYEHQRTPVTITVCWDGSGDYITIQEGIDAALNGDEVVACDGTYTGVGNRSIQFNGKAITVRSKNGPKTCIIDCEENSTGFRLVGGLTPESIVDGFTIKNGSAAHGGAIYCRDSAPTITNCIMSGNSADYGTVWIQESSPTITNCLISDNTTVLGGGIYPYDANNPTVANCTIVGNVATSRGGAVYCSGSAVHLTNSILWGNSPQEIHVGSGSVTATYSNIQGGWTGAGNINEDPDFCLGLQGAYYLSQTGCGQCEQSPCVDAGDPTSSTIEGTTRTDGVHDAAVVDMGYHYPDMSCADVETCNDCNACTYDTCTDSVCSNMPRPYGDSDGNGILNLFDIFCTLDLIGGEPVPPECNEGNADIEPCAGNEVLNLLDVFAVLEAIGGIDPCCTCGACCLPDDTCLEIRGLECGESGGEFALREPPAPQSLCTEVTCPLLGPPAPARSVGRALRPIDRSPARMELKLVPSVRIAYPRDTVDVHVFATNASGVRGYELRAALSGGRRGSLEVVSTSILDRRDSVMSGVESVSAIDQANARVVVAALDEGASTPGTGYLATFTLRAADDATGIFRIDVADSPEELIVIDQNGDVRTVHVTPARIRIVPVNESR